MKYRYEYTYVLFDKEIGKPRPKQAYQTAETDLLKIIAQLNKSIGQSKRYVLISVEKV